MHFEVFCSFIVIVLIVNLKIILSIEESPVVTTKTGSLIGEVLDSRDGRKYFSFKGIPYAQPPVRFEPPERALKWEGTLQAIEFGSPCPQRERLTQKVIGDENCLFLNVYTPKLTGHFPVIVYIHGGAFMFGSGDAFGPQYFMDEDVILVTLNYRLAALGFLSTGDKEIQGNMGLKDQIMALRWIKENILFFGGDSSRITLMGESAGAACVSLHIVSPMSKGLFNFAISQSGSALNPWAFYPKPQIQAFELGENLGCPTDSTKNLANCLRTKKAKDIIQITFTRWFKDPMTPYGPTAETLHVDQSVSDVFLTEDPYVLLHEGRFTRTPWMVGITEEEGILLHAAVIIRNEELSRDMNENWNRVAPITFLYSNDPNIPEEELDTISRQIRGFYFGDKKVSESTEKNLTNLYSDRYFNHGVKLAALLQAKYSPVYPFIIAYHGENTYLNYYYPDLVKEPLGISHGDDVQYFFSTPFFPPFEPESKSEEFSKAVVKMWSSFAKTGNLMESMGSPRIPWLPVSPEEIRRKKLKWYNLDFQPRVILEPFTERLNFWHKINDQLRALSNLDDQSDDDMSKDEL